MSLPQDVNDRNYRKHRETSKGVAVAVIDDSLPVDGNNPSATYDLSSDKVVIQKTIGSDTYQQTIDWSTNPISESEWTKL